LTKTYFSAIIVLILKDPIITLCFKQLFESKRGWSASMEVPFHTIKSRMHLSS